jgi:hypothetical protein
VGYLKPKLNEEVLWVKEIAGPNEVRPGASRTARPGPTRRPGRNARKEKSRRRSSPVDFATDQTTVSYKALPAR